MAEEGRKVSLVSLGCKVNQYETQAFREALTVGGAREARGGEAAELVVVNACVVTHRAEKDSRAAVRRALRRNPEAQVIATGCLTDETKALFEAMDRVTVVGAEAKNQVPVIAGVLPAAAVPPSSVEGLRISTFDGRARAFVKVQDGCALNCSFCIIPTVRGGLRSRKVADIVAEVEDLARNGYREVVLTGVHLGHFGRGKGEQERLEELLRALAAVEGILRIRLSSFESFELKAPILEALCHSEKFVPHFHLPLQSGSDRVLGAMRRRYSVAEYMAGIEELWRRFERPSLSTDVIVGFPGETEAEFEETLAVMRAAGFGRTHVFSYSDREGTDASRLEPKVPPELIKERTQRAIALGNRLAWRYSKSFLGEEVEVLGERVVDGLCEGYSERYIRVRYEGDAGQLGEVVKVRLSEVDAQGEARGAQLGVGAGALPV